MKPPTPAQPRQLWSVSIEISGGWEGYVVAATKDEAQRLADDADHDAYFNAETTAYVGEPLNLEDEGDLRDFCRGRDARRMDVIGCDRMTREALLAELLAEREEIAEAERRKDVPGTDEYRDSIEKQEQFRQLRLLDANSP